MALKPVMQSADGSVGPYLQGLSTELGAFVAGVMLSATDQQENALHQLEQVCGLSQPKEPVHGQSDHVGIWCHAAFLFNIAVVSGRCNIDLAGSAPQGS